MQYASQCKNTKYTLLLIKESETFKVGVKNSLMPPPLRHNLGHLWESSQAINWLILTNKTVWEITQTKYKNK